MRYAVIEHISESKYRAIMTNGINGQLEVELRRGAEKRCLGVAQRAGENAVEFAFSGSPVGWSAIFLGDRRKCDGIGLLGATLTESAESAGLGAPTSGHQENEAPPEALYNSGEDAGQIATPLSQTASCTVDLCLQQHWFCPSALAFETPYFFF